MSDLKTTTAPTYPLILLAEDDLDDQELLLDAIQIAYPEIQLSTVNNGKKVVDFLEELPDGDLPSLIILDYNMPELDGAQVLEQLNLQTRLQGIPKLVWSTSSSPVYKTNCLQLGARAYFEKPSNITQLQQLAQKMVQFIIPS